MLQVHEERDASVIVCKEFPPDQIGLYGAVDYERAGERLLKIKSLIEQPAPGEAPSSYAVLGRYVFTPGIFDALDQVKPRRGGRSDARRGVEECVSTCRSGGSRDH